MILDPMTPPQGEALPFITGDREWPSEQEALEAIHLSNELGKAGNFDEALAVLNQAIEDSGPNPYLYYNAGHWLSIKGCFDEASLEYEKSLALDDRNLSVLCSHAYALARLGRQLEAIHTYDCALALDPTAGEIYFLKAASLQALGDSEAAQVETKRGKELGATPQKNLIREVLNVESNC